MIQSIILILVALTIGKQLFGFLRTKKEVLLFGRMAGGTGVFVLLLLVLALPAIEPEGVGENLLLYVSCVGILGVYLIARPGLSDSGLAYSGKLIPYSQFEYYHFSRETPKIICFRLHSREKDYIVLFRAEHRERLIAMMDTAGVPDWDSFSF